METSYIGDIIVWNAHNLPHREFPDRAVWDPPNYSSEVTDWREINGVLSLRGMERAIHSENEGWTHYGHTPAKGFIWLHYPYNPGQFGIFFMYSRTNHLYIACATTGKDSRVRGETSGFHCDKAAYTIHPQEYLRIKDIFQGKGVI